MHFGDFRERFFKQNIPIIKELYQITKIPFIYLSHKIESFRITPKESMHCNGSSSELQKHVFTLI